jgi:hypothetical protein
MRPTATKPLTAHERHRRVLLLCCSFARNISIYKQTFEAGAPLLDTRHEYAGFWREISSSCLDIALLEWCKVWADVRGKHFWKRVVRESEHDFFQRQLFARLKVSSQAWDILVSSVKTYRDQFIAHLDDNRVMQIPRLDQTREAIWFLYDYLSTHRDEIIDLAGLPKTIDEFERGFAFHSANAASVFEHAQSLSAKKVSDTAGKEQIRP